MSARTDRINRHIQRTMADILLKEADLPNDVLVTISRVDTTPNLKKSSIWLYVQPLERGEEILEMLQDQIYDIQGALNRALNMRPLPRISFFIDGGSAYAQQIEEKLAEIEQEDSSS